MPVPGKHSFHSSPACKNIDPVFLKKGLTANDFVYKKLSHKDLIFLIIISKPFMIVTPKVCLICLEITFCKCIKGELTAAAEFKSTDEPALMYKKSSSILGLSSATRSLLVDCNIYNIAALFIYHKFYRFSSCRKI